MQIIAMMLLKFPFNSDRLALVRASLGLKELGGYSFGVGGKRVYMLVGGGIAVGTDNETITIRRGDLGRLEPGQAFSKSLVDFWMQW